MSNRLVEVLCRAWTTVVLIYTSGRQPGCRNSLLLFFICLTISLFLSSLIYFGLHVLNNNSLISGSIAGVTSLLTAATLFLSKRLRCFIFLFILSSVMKAGRNLLLTSGAGIMACLSVQNMFSNLRKMSESLMCTLKKKQEFLHTHPMENYLRMLTWVKTQVETLSYLKLAEYTPQLTVKHTLHSDELRKKLEEAEEELRATMTRFEAILATVTSIGRKLAPLLGFVLLGLFTMWFLKKYLRDKKYNNTFITEHFVRYDECQKAAGKSYVLPLSKQEAQKFVSIPCAAPQWAELVPMAFFYVPVGTQVALWLLLMVMDALVHWCLALVQEHLLTLKPLHVPLILTVHISILYESIYYTPERTTEIISIRSTDVIRKENFSYSVNIFEKECIPELTLLLSDAVTPLSASIAVLLLLGLIYAKLKQLQLLATEKFFTDMANKRVKHLHAKILHQRLRMEADERGKVQFQSLKKNIKFWFPILDFCRERKNGDLHLSTLQNT